MMACSPRKNMLALRPAAHDSLLGSGRPTGTTYLHEYCSDFFCPFESSMPSLAHVRLLLWPICSVSLLNGRHFRRSGTWGPLFGGTDEVIVLPNFLACTEAFLPGFSRARFGSSIPPQTLRIPTRSGLRSRKEAARRGRESGLNLHIYTYIDE